MGKLIRGQRVRKFACLALWLDITVTIPYYPYSKYVASVSPFKQVHKCV